MLFYLVKNEAEMSVAISSISVVTVPVEWFFAFGIVLIAFVIFLGGLIIVYFERKDEELKNERKQMRMEIETQVRREVFIGSETQEVPIGKRYSSPLDDISPTLEHRLIRYDSGSDHYPFLLPSLDPVTPFPVSLSSHPGTGLPNVMYEPSRISRVVMRANDWIECRDQYGFVMPEYSGLWQNVGMSVMAAYDGEWMVPKQTTGYHNVIRFKRVRPQDHRIPPILHPRDLPEIPKKPAWPANPREMSPLQ